MSSYNINHTSINNYNSLNNSGSYSRQLKKAKSRRRRNKKRLDLSENNSSLERQPEPAQKKKRNKVMFLKEEIQNLGKKFNKGKREDYLKKQIDK